MNKLTELFDAAIMHVMSMMVDPTKKTVGGVSMVRMRGRPSKTKKGKTDKQLHAERYPAMHLHPQISQRHLDFWNKC